MNLNSQPNPTSGGLRLTVTPAGHLLTSCTGPADRSQSGQFVSVDRDSPRETDAVYVGWLWGRAWCCGNLWRRTDYLGFSVYAYVRNDVDRSAKEIVHTGYLVEIVAHSEYPRSQAYETALIDRAFDGSQRALQTCGGYCSGLGPAPLAEAAIMLVFSPIRKKRATISMDTRVMTK
jgi:hypothetical protein